MSPAQVVRIGLGAAFLVLLGAFVATRLEVTSGITHFVSTGDERDLSSVARHMAESTLARTMILSVGAPDLATAIEATRAWAGRLEGHPEVAAVRAGPSPGFAPSVFGLYFPHRFQFLSPHPETELPERLSDGGLREAAERLRRELALPEGQLVKQVAPADPLLAFPDLLRRFEDARLGGLNVSGSRFVDDQASHAILLVTTRHSPFDADHQGPLAAFVEHSFAELDRRFGGELRLEQSGVHRFAARSEARARQDIARISGVSLVGLLVLFLAMFRSLRLLLIAVVPLAAGILAATATGILAFGSVHVLTLVFGSTLIGVCIDYPLHYLTHHTLLPHPGGPHGSLARVWPALLMGAATTAAGFAGLAASDFPGVREIGVFAGVGVMTALVTTRWLVPPLVPARPTRLDLPERLARRLGRLLGWAEGNRRGLIAIPVAGLALCAVGLPRLEWEDDVYALNLPLESAWVAEDARVRARVSRVEGGQVVLALGSDEEALLRSNERIHDRLVEARERRVLDGFQSLHSFLWSEQLQTRNLSALGRAPRLAERTLAALRAEGFRPAAFGPFVEALEGASPEPLRLRDLLGSPLADLVSPFHLELEHGAALITFLRGVRDPAALESTLAGLEGVHYFDQRRFLEEVYGRYRDRTLPLVLIGVLAVVGLLHLRYRRPARTLALASPALLAAGGSLALLSLGGVAINLLHLLGCLLVLSFGVDYSIFLIESRRDSDHASVTLLSLVVACVSTCLSFGLLALSSFPALRALGVVTGLGVLLSLVLAPTALVLAGAPPPAPGARGPDGDGGEGPRARRRSRRALRLGLVALGLVGCAGRAPPPGSEPPPAELVSTHEVVGDFLLRQHVAYRFGERRGSFEAVVQKQCDRLTVIGFTPFGTRAFTLQQRGLEVQVETHVPEAWPFPPQFVLLDVQRAYLLPVERPSGSERREFARGPELVTETWSEDRLVERSFRLAAGPPNGRVLVQYAPGAARAASPGRVRIVNERYGYQLDVATLARSELECP